MVNLRLTRRFALPELPLLGKKKRKSNEWEGEAPAEPKKRREAVHTAKRQRYQQRAGSFSSRRKTSRKRLFGSPPTKAGGLPKREKTPTHTPTGEPGA